MTLGRLFELYQAEQQGKQIMMREHRYGYFEDFERIIEVKLLECGLSLLASEPADTAESDYFESYIESGKEADILRCRISERILNSPKNYFHYYHKRITKQEAINLLYN